MWERREQMKDKNEKVFTIDWYKLIGGAVGLVISLCIIGLLVVKYK